MADPAGILIGKGEQAVTLLAKYGNRHGLIAGATGTGKTVSLQVLAEGFSSLGVPVFLSDIKGDLTGISQPGEPKPKILERAKTVGIADYQNLGFPAALWELQGERGNHVRATVSDMGPLLFTQLLGLNDTQEGVLNIAFKLADDEGLLLLDFKDLRAMLAHISENASKLKANYGNVSPTSVGAIQRSLLVLEQQGAERFFGEPALDIADLMRTAPDGRGMVNILLADKLMDTPRLYSTFLLWMLSELFEELPEVGDLDKPKLVFFFDEAHLLFDSASPSLLQKVEQVVRLVRSKGVGVYFITQNPLDVPDVVLGQLGNRIQHALRAFTPRDQKAVRAAAETFRAKEGMDAEKAIMELGVGEALASTLDEKGVPTPVERILVRPPASRIGPATDAERQAILSASTVGARYSKTVDRESAYEMLKRRVEGAATQAEEKPAPRSAGRRSDSPVEAMLKSTMRAAGSQLGRTLIRGIMGTLFGKKSSGRR
jgi:uncharacterized protein